MTRLGVGPDNPITVEPVGEVQTDGSGPQNTGHFCRTDNAACRNPNERGNLSHPVGHAGTVSSPCGGRGIPSFQNLRPRPSQEPGGDACERASDATIEP